LHLRVEQLLLELLESGQFFFQKFAHWGMEKV
jgi:hypothetical protein